MAEPTTSNGREFERGKLIATVDDHERQITDLWKEVGKMRDKVIYSHIVSGMVMAIVLPVLTAMLMKYWK